MVDPLPAMRRTHRVAVVSVRGVHSAGKDENLISTEGGENDAQDEDGLQQQ